MEGNVDQDALDKYMTSALKRFVRSLKRAKTFETQRLIKKLKRVREGKFDKGDSLEELEAQLVALKSLELDSLACSTVRTRLSKLAKASPAIDSALAQLPKETFASRSDPKSAHVKATNRVLASKAAVDEWKDILYLIKEKAGLEVTGERPRYANANAKREKHQQQQQTKAQTKTDKQETEQASLPVKATERDQVAVSNDSDSQEEEEESGADDAALPHLSRVEVDDVEDDDEDDHDEVDDDDEVARELARFSQDEDSDDDGQDESADDDSADDVVASDDDGSGSSEVVTSLLSPKQKVKAMPAADTSDRRPAKKQKLASSSTFLPSLASGYVSFSDDDEDARWIKQAEREDRQAERKNRPGQRARRALWEKKYGDKAKHVVKARKGDPSSAAAAAAAAAQLSSNLRGAKLVQQQKELEQQERAEREAERKRIYKERQQRQQSRVQNGSQPTRDRQDGPTSANAVQVSDKRAGKKFDPAKDGPVHPSWEAKRKAQEALQAAPKGKKIKFD